MPIQHAQTHTLATYAPSGKVGAFKVFEYSLVAMPVAVLAGLFYGWIVSARWHMAWICLSAVVGGLILGAQHTALLRRAHSRSRRFNTLAAAAFAATFLWARWFGGLASLVGWATAPVWPLTLLLDLSELSQRLPQAGGGHGAAGWYLAAWLLEAVVVCFAIGLSRDEADSPYSEPCSQWAKQDFEGELLAPGGLADGLIPRLEARGSAALLEMPSAGHLVGAPVAASWSTIRLKGHAVAADDQARWLDVAIVAHERTNEGKVKSTARTVVRAWQVSAEEFDALRGHIAASAHGPQSSKAAGQGANPEQQHGDGAAPVPAVLGPAISAFTAEDFGLAVSFASGQKQHPDQQVRADAMRLCALSLSRLERWQEAFDEYFSLFDIEPTADCALNLATTSVRAGELLRGQAWFERAEQINAQSHEVRQPEMRTVYLSALSQAGEYQACLQHIDWLADAYRLVHITDDHLLWSKGLPFLGVFLDKSMPILQEALGDARTVVWFRELGEGLDDDGKAMINAKLNEQMPGISQ